MAQVEKLVLIGYSSEQMFELVDRVEDYPKFLPWCAGTELIERTDAVTAARIHIRYRGVSAHFATANPKVRPLWMKIELREGPFKRLEGGWEFTSLGDEGCKINFRLSYEFSGKVLEKLLSPVFNHITSTFVDSFVKEAHQRYG
jgi:ribosome-associated toxin RatA of RatAB toxin-antitoxin module